MMSLEQQRNLRENFPSLQEIKAEQIKRSFKLFIREFWNVIIKDPLVWNWHIDYIADELQKVAFLIRDRKPKEYDLIINVPPGTSKSTIVTIMFPAWCWTIDPTMKFITGSYSGKLSTEHAVYSRDIIKSEEYTKLFPDIGIKFDRDNKTSYENEKGGLRIATSVGGTITGEHAHCILIDDPIKPKDAYSEVARANAKKWMSETLSTRTVSKELTPTILIMQRIHEDDPTQAMLDWETPVRHICLPGELSEDIKPLSAADFYVDGLLDPQRLGKPVLADLRKKLGLYGYAGQIQQNPVPDQGGYMKKNWFIDNIIEYKNVPQDITTHFYSDTSYGDNAEADRSAMLAFSIYENTLIIWEAYANILDFNEFVGNSAKGIRGDYIKFIERNRSKPTASRHIFEKKASGPSIIQYLKANMPFIVREDTLIGGESKVVRVQSILPLLENGYIKLVRGSWNDEFIKECISFPKGKYDDMVDTLTGAVRASFIDTTKPPGFVQNKGKPLEKSKFLV